MEETKGEVCPRCGVGKDTDGDGNCALCAPLSEESAATLKQTYDPTEEPPFEPPTDPVEKLKAVAVAMAAGAEEPEEGPDPGEGSEPEAEEPEPEEEPEPLSDAEKLRAEFPDLDVPDDFTMSQLWATAPTWEELKSKFHLLPKIEFPPEEMGRRVSDGGFSLAKAIRQQVSKYTATGHYKVMRPDHAGSLFGYAQRANQTHRLLRDLEMALEAVPGIQAEILEEGEVLVRIKGPKIILDAVIADIEDCPIVPDPDASGSIIRVGQAPGEVAVVDTLTGSRVRKTRVSDRPRVNPLDRNEW